MKVKSEREVAQLCRLLVTPWTIAYQAPPSMGLSRQEYWSGVPLPSPDMHAIIPLLLLLLLLLSSLGLGIREWRILSRNLEPHLNCMASAWGGDRQRLVC